MWEISTERRENRRSAHIIALGEEDRAALRTLKEKYNVTFNTKSTPTGADTASNVDITKYL